MGSWNKTCGLSGLHIFYDTPVNVFLLERVNDIEDMCYGTCLYRPLLLPFYSHYNDYGAGENSSGPFLDVIMDSLKAELIEVEQGENEYHDIAVKKDEWNEELFWEAIHKRRLQIKTYKGTTAIDAVMFRNDIVERVFSDWTCSFYKDGTNTVYKFNDVVKEVPAIVARAKELLANYPADVSPYMCKFENLYKWEQRTIASEWLRPEHRYSRIVDVQLLFFKLISKGKYTQADTLLKEHLKALWLDGYMNSIRKLWIPGGFEGSQSQESQGYKLMANAILDVLNQEDSDE